MLFAHVILFGNVHRSTFLIRIRISIYRTCTVSGFAFSSVAFAIVKSNAVLEGQSALLVAFLLFCYQTCDGTDGKQARNTKSGSPIGEIVDHGVDALVTSWYAAVIMSVTSTTFSEEYGFWFLTLAQCAFVASQLTLLHIGKQFIGQFDSQEGQVFVQGLCLLSGFGLRSYLWDDVLGRELFTLGGHPWEGRDVILSAAILQMGRSVLAYGYDIVSFYSSNKAIAKGKAAKKIESVRSFAYQATQLCIFVLLSRACYHRLEQWQWFFLSSFAIADLSNRVLVSRVVCVPTPWFTKCFGIMILAAFVGNDIKNVSGWVWVAAMAASHTGYLITRLRLFATALEIRLFSIPH